MPHGTGPFWVFRGAATRWTVQSQKTERLGPLSGFGAFLDERTKPADKAQMGEGRVRVAPHVRGVREPLLPQAARSPEAVGSTTSQFQDDELESAHDDGLVVREVRGSV